MNIGTETTEQAQTRVAGDRLVRVTTLVQTFPASVQFSTLWDAITVEDSYDDETLVYVSLAIEDADFDTCSYAISGDLDDIESSKSIVAKNAAYHLRNLGVIVTGEP